MPNQPMQINRKEFKELLDEIKQYNKLDLVAQAIQTKYAKDMAEDDHEERLAAQKEANDLLKKIFEAVKNGSNQTARVGDKIDKLSKDSKDYKPVSGIKDNKPATVKENLKSFVAGTKKLGSGIKSAFTGLMKPKRTPSGDIEAAGGFLERVGKAGKDILTTPEDYTVEGGRFAEAYSRTAEGTSFQKGGKGSLNVGLEKFNELKAKEEEIKKVQKKIDEQKKYGFEPNKGDVEQLKKLKSDYAEADIRTKPVSAKETIESKGTTENPNITDTPQEKIAEEAKKQTQSFSELLNVTKESLGELKAIRTSLEGTSPTGQPSAAPKTAPVAAAPVASEEGGLSPLDLLGRGRAAGGKAAGGAAAGKAGAAGAAKAGFGTKALGALKAGGAMLGKGALVAGKAVAGAALSKPALIAGAVGLAAYGAYKGYQALSSKDEQPTEEKNPFVEQTKKSKEAQALKKLNEEGKYTFEPKGRTVLVYEKETGKLVRSIQAPKEVTGAELMQAADIGTQAPQPAPMAKPKPTSVEPTTDTQEPILSPYETMGQPPASKPDTARSIQNRQAAVPIETQPTQSGEPAPKKSIGQRIASFFGFGDKKEAQPQQTGIGDAIARQEGRIARSLEARRAGKEEQPSSVALAAVASAPVKAASSADGDIDTQIADKKRELDYHAGRSSPKSLERVKVLNRELAILEAKKMRQGDQSAQVQPAAPSATPAQVATTTTENQAMRDETAVGGRTAQPVVMNNVSNNTQTTYVPIKGEPRPGSRGSALDRYSDRVAAY